MSEKPIYFPGLNGLRAIAAIAVVVSHITISLDKFGLDPHIFGTFGDGKPKGIDLAGYGVSLFFVLSGFLITYLLQVEKGVQPIDVKKFYVRRILRIWPLYYVYLTIAVILLLAFKLDEGRLSSLPLYIFYAANVPLILRTELPLLAHYWSLGVEEQFYLFWPWVNKRANSLLLPAAVATVALVATKITLHFLHRGALVEATIETTRFHCMMIGALAAVLYKQRHVLFLRVVDNKLTQALSWFVILLAAINKFHVASIIDNELISVVAAFLIVGQVRVQNRILNLEVRVLDFLGRISYGIYVIHPLLIFLLSKALLTVEMGTPLKYFVVYGSVMGGTVAVSYLSFTYLEKYFLGLKKRFVVVDSTSSRAA